MANVKIFGLGGFGEYGNNLYVILHNNKYYILDCGIKYPNNELYGIDEIIPDFSVLSKIKKDIQGIFISHAHEEQMGGLVLILKELNVNLYATSLAMEVIKDDMKENNMQYPDDKMHIINENSIIKFEEGVQVSFIKTTHSIPESMAIVIKTSLGNILYTSEFSFNEGKNPLYRTNYKRISEVAEEGILALLIESFSSKKSVQVDYEAMFNYEIENIFKTAKGRMIFSLFSNDLLKIQKIIDYANLFNKKIAIVGRKAQRLVDIAIKYKYLNIPSKNFKKLLFIDDKIKNDDKNLVVLVSGMRHEPFHMLQRMTRKQDKLIHINKNDTIVILTPPALGIETVATKTFDLISRSEANLILIKQDYLTTMNATNNEIKMMMNLTRPKYIIPVIGEYQHQVAVFKIAKEIGYHENNCFLLENGDILELSLDSQKIFKKDIPTGEILIDGTPIYDKNDVVIKDRELLASDGIIIISANVGSRENKQIGETLIRTNGFYNPPHHDEFIKELSELFQKLFNDMIKKPRRMWNDIKRKIRSQLTFFVNQSAQRNPVLIIMINEV